MRGAGAAVAGRDARGNARRARHARAVESTRPREVGGERMGVRMARATNLICILVIAGTAVGVRAVHESQNEERRRLREGVIRDEARLRAREARERGREGTTKGI